jgi:hypothetical protein
MSILGVTDTLRSDGGLGCGVVLGLLGESTSSKTSLMEVACWKGATCARQAGVLGTDAGNGGGNHVVSLGASLSSSFFQGMKQVFGAIWSWGCILDPVWCLRR